MTEPDSPLAAMITALAEVDRAQKQGKSWNDIADEFGYPSGCQAKKIIHGLRVKVKRELVAMLAKRNG